MRLLLCTDLDRTLLPNGEAAESPRARPCFSAVAAREETALVYVTGRHLALLEEAIAIYDLPHPDYAVTDVGTRVRRRVDGGWHEIAAWSKEIDGDWNGADAGALAPLFDDLGTLVLQESEKQGKRKLSYYHPSRPPGDDLVAEMRRRLDRGGVRAAVVASFDETSRTGLVDVLPASATKLHAVEFLRRRLGYGVGEVLFAGDSGNDIDVMASGIPSVLVANATDAVRAAARARAAEAGNAASLYEAHGGLPGLNGNYAAGILEGLVHFHPAARRWLEACGGLSGALVGGDGAMAVMDQDGSR